MRVLVRGSRLAVELRSYGKAAGGEAQEVRVVLIYSLCRGLSLGRYTVRLSPRSTRPTELLASLLASSRVSRVYHDWSNEFALQHAPPASRIVSDHEAAGAFDDYGAANVRPGNA